MVIYRSNNLRLKLYFEKDFNIYLKKMKDENEK